VRNHVLALDAVIAVVLAALVIIVSPGLAVTAIVALLVLLVVGISYAWSARRRRSTLRH
jgi:ABC-type bacteriocin/lantibiotic exporter with double-glycine peptidase domain